MNARYPVLMLALAAVVGAAIATIGAQPSATNAQPRSTASSWKQTTPWGDPDLQGVWRYEAAIPLERPARFAGRESLTDEELKESQRIEDEQAKQRLAGAEGAAVGRQSVAESPIRGNEYNSFWQDHGRPRQVLRHTSLIVDPKDGRLPYTPDARKAEARASARYGVGPYESYLDPDTGERCLTDGVTALMWPGYVTILHEEYLDRRIIPTDGRSHGSIRQWFGDAVGKWEGSTFVVDTINFIDRTNYEWATIFTRPSETLHIVERFARARTPWTTASPWKIRRRSRSRGRR